MLSIVDYRVYAINDKVESTRIISEKSSKYLRGKVKDVFTPKSPRTSKCPIRVRYLVKWNRRGLGWYFARELMPC